MEDNSKLRKLIRESIMEEMNQKRYVATMEFYVHASDDQDAAIKAKAIADNMDINLDNKASIINIVRQPYGAIGNTPVDFSE